MPKPRIFISHSAREDERALTLLRQLDTRLDQEGFEVLLDRKRLEVGDAWEHKIGTWLDRCHAAIVLFSRKALASDYVKYEVSNLLHRWRDGGAAGQPFDLLPVLVEPLTESELSGFYKTIDLWKVQRLDLTDDTAIIKALVSKLEPLKSRILASDPTSRLKGDLADILEKVKQDFLTDDLARDTLGIDTAGWPPQSVVPRLAEALMSTSMAGAWTAIQTLKRRLDPGVVMKLFDLLMPLWVGPESADALEAVTRSQPGTRCAVVNAEAKRFTPGMYLARARTRTNLEGKVVHVRTNDLGVNVEAGLSARVRAQLEQELEINDPDREFPITLAKELTLRSDSRNPVIVAATLEASSLPALAAVAKTADFASATFLALTKPLAPDGTIPGVTVLHPLLPDGLENHVYDLHFQYSKTLKSS